MSYLSMAVADFVIHYAGSWMLTSVTQPLVSEDDMPECSISFVQLCILGLQL